MILKIKNEALLKALSAVSKALPSRTPFEALYQIKFEASEAGLRLTSSNSDLTVKKWIPISKDELVIQAAGDVLLPGKQLVELTRRLKGEWVTFSLVEQAVLVKSGKSKFTLNATASSLYPNINEPTDENSRLVVSQNELMRLFKETLPFTATQEARPVLTGVCLTLESDCWTCISTDSFQLSKVRVPHQQLLEGKHTFVVPRDSLTNLLKLFPITKEEPSLQLSWDATMLHVETTDLLVSTRLLENAYPDTSAFIPTTFEQMIQVNRSQLLDVVDRLLLLADSNDTVTLTLHPETQVLHLDASQECGRAEEELECQGIQQPLRILFNGKFFKEAIQSLNGTDVLLCFNGDLRPFILHNPEEDQSIRLIVPMRAA